MEEEFRNRLKHAQEYEEKHLPLIPAAVLLAYHLTGGIGWINDPNGFSVYRGEYHLFFQYYPYDTSWGDMYWGHVKSHDLIHWERLPIALAPDEDYDLDGCFSGSALETTDGKHLLMYTGAHRLCSKEEGDLFRQTQCVAVGDGVQYTKYTGNPVIAEEDLPPGSSIHDFRDPKIRWEGGRYLAVVGNRLADGTGAVLQYRMMIACCNDGTRPVVFKIERIDIPENDEETEWLAKQNFKNSVEDAYKG